MLVNQHGNGDTTFIRSRHKTAEHRTGAEQTDARRQPDGLSGRPLAGIRSTTPGTANAPDLSRISVPVLSAGNWGGPGVHMRGNIEGFMGIASRTSGFRCMSERTGTASTFPNMSPFSGDSSIHFLKGDDNGWRNEPRVQLAIRGPKDAPFRMENEFPLARTQWTKFFLDTGPSSIGTERPADARTATYDATGDGITFKTAPFERDTEFTGFVTAHLFVSSSTTDMDIFAILRIFDPEGREVIFVGAHEPTPVTRGWLRASHRKLDPERTLPYRVFHAHDEIQKLTPQQIYELDVEIWPTCMVFPKGYHMALTLMGRDFEFPNTPGRLLHNHPLDRTRDEFGGSNSVLTGGQHASYLLMPLIPRKD